MLQLPNLLGRGYFPKELPPPFTTEEFAALLANHPTFVKRLTRKPKETTLARHSLTKAGDLRRLLSIPNPMSFLQIATWLETNWSSLHQHCDRSPLSLSKPKLSPDERAIMPAVTFDDHPQHRAHLRASSRYVLKTDINNYYPSIYTHSIPWALHTKPKAKKLRKPSDLQGNRLDQLIRQGQHGQTIGIPIGPDTSFLVSEILLSAVDTTFCNKMSLKHLSVNGFRHYDDFELGFTNRADAETAVALLQEVLNEYELQLNPTKTDIIELPAPLEETWVSELRTFEFDRGIQKWSLQRYFDIAYDLSKANRNAGVLKYAIQRLRSINIERGNWSLCEDLLLQCAMVDSSVLPTLIDCLSYHSEQGFSLNRAKIKEVFHILIGLHAPLGHDSEVAWILWGCLLFQLKINDAQATLVAKMEDQVSALMILHAQDSGLTKSKLDVTNWQSVLTADSLRDSHWLFSYEAYSKGWLTVNNDYIASDQQFGVLKQNGVSFYDTGKVSSYTVTSKFKHFQAKRSKYS